MRVLVVDDDARIEDGVRRGLEAEGFAVDVAHNGVDGLWRARETRYDAIVLDLMMPGMSGWKVCEALRAEENWTPVLMLTAKDGEWDQVEALESGADDYVTKPFSPRELVARVRTILRRTGREAQTPVGAPAATTTGASPAPATLGPFEIDDERRRIRYFGQPLELSRYEYGLLRLLARRPGRVYTRDELLEQVWDDPGASLDRTVDAHVKTLRAKLRAVAPALDPIRTLRGTGYALADDLPATR